MRADRRSILAAGAAGLLTAACTSPPKPTPKPPSPATPSAPSASAASQELEVVGAPDGLRDVVRARYAGRVEGPATASLGTWGGARVAVVTLGDDATLAVAGTTGDTWQIVGGWWPSLGSPKPDLGGGPKFVLALGSDARPGQPPYRSRADTIQVLGIDGTGGGGVLGIARDIWAPMPGGGHAKINAAMVFGGGSGMLQAVRSVTGLPIGGYVATTFTGFTAIVDAWGGIPVVVDRAIPFAGGRIEPGPQTLTGAQALAYARERKSLPDGDFGRSRHQGDLLVAAAIKARLQGVGAIPTIMSITAPHCETTVSAADALRFGAAFHRLDPARVGRYVAKGALGWSSDGQSIVLLDDASRAAFTRFRTGRLS